MQKKILNKLLLRLHYEAISLPIRFSIPAVLLLFGSLVGLFSFEREVSLSYLREESRAVRQDSLGIKHQGYTVPM